MVNAAIRKPANAALWGERQPRVANRHLVGFGDYLRDLCGDLAATLGGSKRPLLSCAAVDELLPIATAIRLGFVADELITNAFRHAFPGGRTGRIAVLFTADAGGWQLTVEDSGQGMRGRAGSGGVGLRIAGDLVDELGGRLEMPSVIGGTRCVAVLPRR